MSGIQHGTRLERLLNLRRHVDVEIEAERRAPHRPAPPNIIVTTSSSRPAPAGALAAVVRVPLTAVPHKTLRDWANANGFPQQRVGPVTADAVDAYVEAHQ